MSKFVIGNDHGAVGLAKRVIEFLTDAGHQVDWLGTKDPAVSADYPDIAKRVCGELLTNSYRCAILLCGTGIGISIAANKIKGIRCALLYDSFSAKMACLHNDANAIALGGRIEYNQSIEKILSAFLAAEFEGGRHNRRLEKIRQLEQEEK